MASESELLRLALLAYEAAAEPGLWTGFLKGFTKAVSADFTVLQIHDLGEHVSTVLSGFGLSPRFTQSYNEYYSRRNVWREWGRPLFTAGRVNLSQEMCPREVLERSEFYNDYMLPIGAPHSLGAVFAREGDRAPTVSALRGRGKGAFGESEREVAQFLTPHLSRAWTLHRRLERLAAGESVLDTLPLGVVFVGAGGTAMYCNRAAEEVFRANDGLALRNGALGAADRRTHARLRKAIGDALAPSRPPGPAAVAIPRVSLRREYLVMAAPLLTRFAQFNGMARPMAVVLITDPERQTPARQELMIRIYRLTPREAAVAEKLFEGKSVAKAAEELTITYETARTHLRRVFSKTGVSRQAELLLLMARLPAWPGSF